MTQVIHGLPRAELIKRVFGKSKPAQRESSSNNSGNSKKGE